MGHVSFREGTFQIRPVSTSMIMGERVMIPDALKSPSRNSFFKPHRMS